MNQRRSLRNNRGQVAIEYILLIAAIVAIITSVLGIVRKKFLGDLAKCDSSAPKQTLLCSIARAITPGDGKKFQYYPFKKG